VGCMDTVWFVLPESFFPTDFLPPELRFYVDDARYFMDLVLRKVANRQVDRLGLVRLRADHLRSVMHNRCQAAIVEALVKGGAVERFSYAVGQHPFGFRLAERFVEDKHVRVAARDPRLIGRIKAFHERAEAERCGRMLPVHLELARRQCQLEIDSAAAERVLAAIPVKSNPFDGQGILVENIAKGNFHFSVGRFGRVANSITSLKRELRHTLVINDEPLVSVDLSCAQPSMLAHLIENRKTFAITTNAGGQVGASYWCGAAPPCVPPGSRSLPASSLPLFQRLAGCGYLYKYLLDRLGEAGVAVSREELKRGVLRDVFAKRGSYQSDVEDIFRREFPDVHDFIRRFNDDGRQHANLIRALQRAESQFVIETVMPDLLDRHPGEFFLTLHDAIYTTPGHLPDVERAFKRGFAKTGLRMRYKVAVA
jgi:hypothetical protein